jgi:dinuclear metal center YbgI/SA1388 family protein
MPGRMNGSVTVNQVLQVLDELAPPLLAKEWDKIGLQVGNPDQLVYRALLALDVTPAVIASAAAADCQLIISHHPLIFNPLTTIRTDDPEQHLIDNLIRLRISLIVAHTNLDAAAGGVADCLLDALQDKGRERRTIAGFGRLQDLAQPELFSRLRERVRWQLGSSGCRINTDQDRMVSRLAVFPGSFAEEAIPELVDTGVGAVICGEIKHHLGLMLAARGIAVIDAGHDVTERVVLNPLAENLTGRLPQISFAVDGGLDYNKMAF